MTSVTTTLDCGLPLVRQLEAIGARSWPANTTTFDGAWATRLTASHPSKRLNCITPLDRGDSQHIDKRIAAAERRFESYGRPATFRLSPLAPPELEDALNERNWRAFDTTDVMVLNLSTADLSEALPQVPLADRGRWIDSAIAMEGLSQEIKPGMSELLGRITGQSGLFLSESTDGTPHAAALAVRFGSMVGIFQMLSNPNQRRAGHARQILRNALLWGQQAGATRAWLQVTTENQAAHTLYRGEGFTPVYRYDYRQPAKGNHD